LDPGALDDLYADALPIEGYEHLVRPAPHHQLLILARRVAGADGRLDEKRRRRVDAALAADPRAWQGARAAASGWHSGELLDALERVHADGSAMPRSVRLRAMGPSGAVGRLRDRHRRGFVVSLSGLDGAGKSTQAEALRDALEALDLDAEIVWSSLIAQGSLGWLAKPVKKVIGLVRPSAKVGDGPDETWSETAPTHKPDAGTMLRRQSKLITAIWTTLACISIGWWQLRQTRPRIRRGTVVICDRYTLDTKVHLRYEYGDRPFRFQVGLVKLMSPRPRRAFLVEVSAETAHARKGEYELHQVQRRAELYREEADRMGVERIDGERPREDICAEIGRSVWLATRT
jgi:thymidylate kinase